MGDEGRVSPGDYREARTRGREEREERSEQGRE